MCLINATTTGTEILKSLVLPGISSFTIVDGALISGEDAGNKYSILLRDLVIQSCTFTEFPFAVFSWTLRK